MYIEENSKLADVVFPVPPKVVSLRDYDNVAGSAQKLPVQGYPVVCVSVSIDRYRFSCTSKSGVSQRL